MQLDFMEDVARGAAALRPRLVILYPPHDHFHRMMGVTSSPWPAFKAAVEKRLPGARVVIVEPGDSVDPMTGEVTRGVASRQAA
jgi:L-ascorbate metabolism protein UlaG (beta-lactamase superfamily)